jgi:chromosome partitioning protein
MSAAERIAVMEGELDGIDLVEILQVVGIGRQYTGVELLKADHSVLGTLFIKSGKVVSAMAGAVEGKEAFFQLFQQMSKESRKFFHVFRMPTPEQLAEPIGSLGNMLIEALDVARTVVSAPQKTMSGVLPRAVAPSETSLKKPGVDDAWPAPTPLQSAAAARPAPPSSRRQPSGAPQRAPSTTMAAVQAKPTAPAKTPSAPAHPVPESRTGQEKPVEIQAKKEGTAPAVLAARGGASSTDREHRQPKKSGKSGGRSPIVLAIASPKGGSGKTTIALNLALSLARQERSVILVDGDVNGDVLSAIQGRERAVNGALDVLSGRASADEALLRTMLPHFKIMPALGQELPDPESFNADHTSEWQRLLAGLSEQAEIVIVDCPAGMFGPTRQIMGGCSHLLGVLQAELIASRSFTMFSRALDAVPKSERPEVVGVVLNMLQSRHPGSVNVLSDACAGLPKRWLFDTAIPRSDAFLTATEEGLPLRLLDDKNPPAVSWLFDTLASELTDRLELEVPERKPRQLLI